MQSGLGQGFLSSPLGAVFTSSTSSLYTGSSHSSSPPIPKTIIYRLTTVEARLAQIEFELGDNLTDYPQDDWAKAGSTKLSWDCV